MLKLYLSLVPQWGQYIPVFAYLYHGRSLSPPRRSNLSFSIISLHFGHLIFLFMIYKHNSWINETPCHVIHFYENTCLPSSKIIYMNAISPSNILEPKRKFTQRGNICCKRTFTIFAGPASDSMKELIWLYVTGGKYR